MEPLCPQSLLPGLPLEKLDAGPASLCEQPAGWHAELWSLPPSSLSSLLPSRRSSVPLLFRSGETEAGVAEEGRPPAG